MDSWSSFPSWPYLIVFTSCHAVCLVLCLACIARNQSTVHCCWFPTYVFFFLFCWGGGHGIQVQPRHRGERTTNPHGMLLYMTLTTGGKSSMGGQLGAPLLRFTIHEQCNQIDSDLTNSKLLRFANHLRILALSAFLEERLSFCRF